MEPGVLLQRVGAGDELAWEAFVRQHQGRIFGLAYHYLGHAEDARELAQEAFVQIYRNRHSLPDDSGLVPWMLCITRNLCMDLFRRRKARPPTWDIPVEELGHLAAPDGDPEQQLHDQSRKELVHRALRELTDLNREMILLKDIQGLTLDEIAGLLGIPLGTAKSRSNRARLELAEKLLARGACP
ncbi:MAG: RNA polymerase sigma factor [Geothrix sp.]|nr:RNA polymerase sigma factor [Geothrix sp.]